MPLSTWFAAVWFVTSQKNGMSAQGLQRVLDLVDVHALPVERLRAMVVENPIGPAHRDMNRSAHRASTRTPQSNWPCLAAPRVCSRRSAAATR